MTTAAGLSLCTASFAQDAVVPPPPIVEPPLPVVSASEAEVLQSSPEPAPIVNEVGPEVELNGRPVAETPRRFHYTFF